MRGEIGGELKKIVISSPYYRAGERCKPYFDLQLIDKNGEFLYICGDNDIPKLLREALKEYYINKKKGDKQC